MALNYLTPLNEMREQIERMFNDFSEEAGLPVIGKGSISSLNAGNWMPPIEISETDDEVRVCAALPGIRPEEVNVEIIGNALLLSGETHRESRQDEKHCHRSEFQYGRFMRRVNLPDYAQGDACTANCKDGVLEIHIPKSENTMRKRVEVKAS